tara:strand:+ start:343 stop:486 length:144 start_codon:yes stop_codon:yes gene_type:complete
MAKAFEHDDLRRIVQVLPGYWLLKLVANLRIPVAIKEKSGAVPFGQV